MSNFGLSLFCGGLLAFLLGSPSFGSSKAVMKEIVTTTAIAAGAPPLLMLAICGVESSLRPYPPSGDGGISHGICQLKRIAAEDVLGHSVEDDAIKPPVINAFLAARYLLLCYSRTGKKSWIWAVDCYGRGPRKARKYQYLVSYGKYSYTLKVVHRWMFEQRRADFQGGSYRWPKGSKES